MSNLTINAGVTSSLCEMMRRPAFPTTRLTIGKLLDVNNNAFASLHQSLQQLQNQSQLNELTHPLSQNHSQSSLEHIASSSNNLKSLHTGTNSSNSSNNQLITGKNINSNGICNSNDNNRREKRRYSCSKCPYATDRRDLFTRHENIHRDEKPFRCYVCNKMFNRADHVKKHFLRIHKGLDYDVKLTKRVKGIDYDTNENTPSSVHVNANHLSAVMRDLVTHEVNISGGNKVHHQLIGPSTSVSDVISTRNNLSTTVTTSGGNCNNQLARDAAATAAAAAAAVNSLYTQGLVNRILDQQQQQQHFIPSGKNVDTTTREECIAQRLNEWTNAVGCILSDREEGEVVSLNRRITSGPGCTSSLSLSPSGRSEMQALFAKEKGGRGQHTALEGEIEEGRSKIRCTGAYEVDSPESFCLLSPVNSPCDSADSSSSSPSSSSPSSSSSPCSLSPSSPSSPPSTSASSSTSQDVRAVEDKKSIIVPTTTTTTTTTSISSSLTSIRSSNRSSPHSSSLLCSALPLHSSLSPLSSLRSLPPPLAPPPPPPPVSSASAAAASTAAAGGACTRPPSPLASAASSSSSSLLPPPPPRPPPPLPPPSTALASLTPASTLNPYAATATASSALLRPSSQSNPPNGTALTPNSTCNYNSLSTNTLRVHLAAKLNAKSNYECEECGCNFVDYASLHTHRYLLHEYICHTSNCLPYTCVICGVKTQTQRSMIQHMTIHSFIGRKLNSTASNTRASPSPAPSYASFSSCSSSSQSSASSSPSPSSSSSSSFSPISPPSSTCTRIDPSPSRQVTIMSTGAKSINNGKKRKKLLLDVADMVKLKNQKKSLSSVTSNTSIPFDSQLYCVTSADSFEIKNDASFSNHSSSSTRRKQLLPRKILKSNLT